MNSRRVERVGRRLKSHSKPPHSAKWLAMSKARSHGVEYLRCHVSKEESGEEERERGVLVINEMNLLRTTCGDYARRFRQDDDVPA